MGTTASGVNGVRVGQGVGFLFDENIPPKFAEALRLVGYQTVSNADANLLGAADEAVIDYCAHQNVVWVTKDLDCRKKAAYAARVRDGRVSAVFLAPPRAKGWSSKEQFEVLVRHLRTIEGRYSNSRSPRYFLCRSRGQPRELTSFAARSGNR